MVQKMPGTPLALTVFTSSAGVFHEYTNKCPSGMAFRNDMVVHMASSHVSHGGLGNSGIGAYHGKKVSPSLSVVNSHVALRPFREFLFTKWLVHSPHIDLVTFLILTKHLIGWPPQQSFETFTHCLTVCHRPQGAIYDLNNLRCHPRDGLRGKLLTLATTILPDIPNLHTRKVLTVLGIAVFLKVFVDLSGLAVKPLLADILEAGVNYLRK